MARARAVNLSLQDLPPEFVAIPPTEGEGGDGGAVRACVNDLKDEVVAEAESPTFQRATEAGLVFAASSTTILGDEASAAQLVGALQEPAAVACLRDSFATTLIDSSSGASLQEATLEEAPDFPAFGEASAALAGSLRFTAPPAEQPVELNYSLVLVQTDAVVSLLLYGGVIDSFPPETQRELTAVVAGRQT